MQTSVRAWGGLLAAVTMTGCQDFGVLGSQPDDTAAPLETERVHDVLQAYQNVPVDVLWVVDNSRSMNVLRQALSTHMGDFLEHFQASRYNWRMGVITTDVSDPAQAGRLVETRGRSWVERADAGPEKMFGELIANIPDQGADEEMAFSAVRRFMQRESKQRGAGFLRDFAALHVIVVSDEPEQSGDDPDVTGLVGAIRNHKFDPDMANFSAVAGPMPDGCWLSRERHVPPAPRYEEAADSTGGDVWSICEDDWRAILIGLSYQGRPQIEGLFHLSRIPIESSMQVWAEVLDPATGETFEVEGFAASQVSDGACDDGSCFTWTFDPDLNAVWSSGLQALTSEGAWLHVSYDTWP